MSGAGRSLLPVVLAVIGGCIIPDRGIRVESDAANPGAVRIVEAARLPEELTDPCESDKRLNDQEAAWCANVPTVAVRRGLIPGGPYCSCPGRDGTPAPEFSVYAEDPDRRRDLPTDTLYAVALLDLDPATTTPQNFVAYPEHLTPGGPGERTSWTLASSPQGREDNGLWRFRVGKDGGEGIDLCNDNNGASLSPGLHSLQVMVTDRPFFQPPRLDEDGDPVTDSRGRPLLAPPQYGMPDLGIGATWSVANYVFLCEDPASQPNCNCVEEDG